VVQYDDNRRTLPRLDMHVVGIRKMTDPPLAEACTGVAWLSSARAVRCSVKSGNERNPYGVLYHSHGTASATRRKVGTKSSHHGLDALGHTRATMATTTGCHPARGS